MAQGDDEGRPKSRQDHSLGEDLDALSVDEIDRRIALLGMEIERLEREKVRKKALRGAADAFFKSG